MQFKAMLIDSEMQCTHQQSLIDQNDHNVWLRLIDGDNIVHAFDVSVGSWDMTKDFSLGQGVDSYQMMPTRHLLIALKPQYESTSIVSEIKISEDFDL